MNTPTMHTDPLAAVAAAVAQFDGNLSEFGRNLQPQATQSLVHKWLKRGVPAGRAPAVEVASRRRCAELGRPDTDVVLCEYLAPEEPWSAIRRAKLTPDQRRMVDEAMQAQANRQAVQPEAA